jgi:GNAT superfamily N-acetyltransferase
MDSTRVFVGVNRGLVVGYFALTMGSVPKARAPARLVRGLPGYPVSCVVLARFAIERAAQGRGLGILLLAHAIGLGYRAGQSVAARLLVVDAINADAAAFYEKFAFTSVPEHPLQLFVRLEDIARSLEVDP